MTGAPLPRTPRAAALIAAAAFATSFAGPAQADQNVYCTQVQSMQTSYPPSVSTRDVNVCVPWPD